MKPFQLSDLDVMPHWSQLQSDPMVYLHLIEQLEFGSWEFWVLARGNSPRTPFSYACADQRTFSHGFYRVNPSDPKNDLQLDDDFKPCLLSRVDHPGLQAYLVDLQQREQAYEASLDV